MMIKALGKWCMHKRFEEKVNRTLITLENCKECRRLSIKISRD